MEASALARAPGRGLLARRSPLLRFESDVRLVGLIRAGHDQAFDVLFRRYHSRLLAFCQSMLKSRQDAEDVLQEVFANAHSAMLRDERAINVRPWLYRIARNRCLNHLRRPVPEGQDSMDIHPHANGTSTAERVQDREELREVLADVQTLPETQRTALLLREIDQLSYEEIAQAMDATVPAVKSLLVRARIALAESSQARMLTCGEVQVDLAEAAEGVGRASGPVRKHVRSCEECKDFRDQLRSSRKALAALLPVGPIALLKEGILAKLFGGGSAASGGAIGGASAVGGAGALSGALGAKAAAGFATAALITAGAVEVRQGSGEPDLAGGQAAQTAPPLAPAPAGPAPRDAEPSLAVVTPPDGAGGGQADHSGSQSSPAAAGEHNAAQTPGHESPPAVATDEEAAAPVEENASPGETEGGGGVEIEGEGQEPAPGPSPEPGPAERPTPGQPSTGEPTPEPAPAEPEPETPAPSEPAPGPPGA